MKKANLLLSTALIGALFTAPAFAGKDDDERGKKDRYKDHYMANHQMHMDMMRMLAETMTILRDLNHTPSAEEKAKLDDMIKQLNNAMSKHKEMGQKRDEMKDKKEKERKGRDDDGENEQNQNGDAE